jgi:hypothetical protein
MTKKHDRARRHRSIPTTGRATVRLRHGTAEIHEGDVLGPGMTRADDATILAALDRLDPDRPWSAARADVRPMLPRVRPFPAPVEPVRTMLPPGILVGFGVDIGPALTMVDRPQLDRWGVDVDPVAERALDNVRAIAARCDPGRASRQSIADVPLVALQTGEGIAAALLLVPETLPRFFGPGPQLLLAPMRDVLIALPASVDRDLAAWLAAEWEALDPNHLHLGGFLHEGGSLSPIPLDDAFATA